MALSGMVMDPGFHRGDDQAWIPLLRRNDGNKSRLPVDKFRTPGLQTVSQCHSEPEAKNLLFVRRRKNRCFACAQHDIQVICSIAASLWSRGRLVPAALQSRVGLGLQVRVDFQGLGHTVTDEPADISEFPKTAAV